MDNQPTLPSLPLYRRNCHSWDKNYMVYLTSTTELKIVQFHSHSNNISNSNNNKESQNNQVKNFKIVKIPLEPVRGLRVVVDDQRGVFVAVVFVTRFIVYFNGELYYQSMLQLNKSIQMFQDGYSAVHVYHNNDRKGFIFVTKNGHISLFDIQNKSRILKTPASQGGNKIQSIAVSYPQVYLGTQDGKVKLCTIQDDNQCYKQICSYDTTSKLPIFNITLYESKNKQKQVICSTCEGQIYLLSHDLATVSTVSAHRCLISRLIVSGRCLYTVGEDLFINKFELLGSRKLKLLRNDSYTKLVSLLFQLNGRPFISFYESVAIKAL